jgi:hypothetical protein
LILQNVTEVAELASRRWRNTWPARFLVDHVTLVQNTVENRWTNLGEFELRVPVSRLFEHFNLLSRSSGALLGGFFHSAT